MTIDSGWVRLLKEKNLDAFSYEIPIKPHTVFIDGQIKLMKPDGIRSWDLFYKCQFENTIKQAFGFGAEVVVLGFDNYRHVPEAKAPTQRKRSNKIEAYDFDEHDNLPSVIPECWPQAIRNRSFKSKVVRMICHNLERLACLKSKTLVIDWLDQPLLIGNPIELPAICYDVTAKRGECDIKAFDYVSLGPLVVFSTDGDYLPIALLHRHVNTIVLYRYTVHLHGKHGKRQIDDTAKLKKNKYEFVNIDKIADVINSEFSMCKNPIHAFVTLVACTGCDFTLNLPRLGPVNLWKHRDVFDNFELCNSKECSDCLMQLILQMFFRLFSNKLKSTRALPIKSNQPSDVQKIYSLIQTHLKNLPSSVEWNMERCNAHAKNTLWTVLYWQLLNQYPSPISVDKNMTSCYGFVLDRAGRTTFEAITKL